MKSSNFQLILIVIFGVGAVFGILVFSGAIPIGKSTQPGASGTVTIWGTIGSDSISQQLQEFNDLNKSFVVNYVQKSSSNFDQNLLEALASGTGPDMIFLPDNLAYHYANRIAVIPYTSYPLATFQNTFASASNVFLTPNGILAFPMTIDPLMMYYNRSVLDANGVTNPPTTWRDMSTLVPTLTKKDDTNKIFKSAIAFGQTSNVAHAKDILTTLFLQIGNPIITLQNGVPQATLTSASQTNTNAALDFYTSFADPSKNVYSWNKSFPEARDAFSQEDLAFYFGYSSELQSLINQNPNQNLFVAPVPQVAGANFKATTAKVMGIAILSSSKNIATSFTVASLLASGDFANKLRVALGVPPARRDLLAQKPNDAYSPIFYDSALFARSWLDPSPVDTNNIFQNMVESVLSNNMNSDAAIKDANTKLGLLLNKN